MFDIETRGTKASKSQVEYLVEFLEANPELVGYAKTQNLKERATAKWELLTKKLNTIEGTTKNAQKWRKYWTDKKTTVKKKAAVINVAQRTGKVEDVPELCDIENRILNLIGGKNFATGDVHLKIQLFHDAEDTNFSLDHRQPSQDNNRSPAASRTPSRENTPFNEMKPLTEMTHSSEITPPREITPSRENTSSGEMTPSREISPSNETMPSREGMASREGMSARERMASREGMSARERMASRGRISARDRMASRERMLTRERMAFREGIPTRERMDSREGMPTRERIQSREGMPTRERIQSRAITLSRENTPSVEKILSRRRMHSPKRILSRKRISLSLSPSPSPPRRRCHYRSPCDCCGKSSRRPRRTMHSSPHRKCSHEATIISERFLRLEEQRLQMDGRLVRLLEQAAERDRMTAEANIALGEGLKALAKAISP